MKSRFYVGFRHEKLVIISESERTIHGSRAWLCLCDCGNKTVVSNIMRTKSCGCARGTHKLSKSREYQTWKHMLSRCNNPNATKYKNYGGRGIKVCKRWYVFQNFFADMGIRPPNHTLDRINNNKMYSKSNCKWSNNYEQNRNKRSNRIVIWNNKKFIISDLAAKYNICCGTLSNRLNRGWSVNDALNKPINIKNRRKKKQC